MLTRKDEWVDFLAARSRGQTLANNRFYSLTDKEKKHQIFKFNCGNFLSLFRKKCFSPSFL